MKKISDIRILSRVIEPGFKDAGETIIGAFSSQEDAERYVRHNLNDLWDDGYSSSYMTKEIPHYK